MRKHGFTLIELLMTLSLMAIIGVMLVPFISNYRDKARLNTDFKNLQSFQTSIERFIHLKDDFDYETWASGGGTINNGSAGYDNTNYPLYPVVIVSSSKTIEMVRDMAGVNDSRYKVLDGEDAGLTSDNVYVVRSTFTGTNEYAPYKCYSYLVWKFRRRNFGKGVDRKHRIVEEADWNTTNASLVHSTFEGH